MLKINKLNVGVEDKTILNDINLNINKGELHVIMGRNGTGKSTLSNIIVEKKGIILVEVSYYSIIKIY